MNTSRTIKFRLWNKNAKSFMMSGEGKIAEITLLNGLWNTNSNLDSYIAQQFTGLLDKNRKGIYEGDILRLIQYSTYSSKYEKDNQLKYSYPLGWIFEVKWARFFFIPFCSGHEEDFEIIGNIFENPELTT